MATDDSLVCNFKKCRKRLTNFCWVTSCSRKSRLTYQQLLWDTVRALLDSLLDVFCDEDAEREFSKGLICPACETQLPGNRDITRVDLQPSEEYKSVRSGLGCASQFVFFEIISTMKCEDFDI